MMSFLFQPGVDISQALLEKCGLWGCILGGCLASNIAQYILTSNLGLRADCCFLSAYFFKVDFKSICLFIKHIKLFAGSKMDN